MVCPFLIVVMMITFMCILMVQKALMFQTAYLHAKKRANYFPVSTNAPMVVRIFYQAQNKFYVVMGFF